MLKNILSKILALIISLIWMVIVLFVFLFVLPSFWLFNGNLLVYNFGIIFEFIKIIVTLLALVVVPLALFVGRQSTKHILSHAFFRWFLFIAFLLFVRIFFPLHHLAVISMPIPEEATKVRYGYGGSNPFQSGFPNVTFYWEASEEEFINFYTSFFEKRGFSNELLPNKLISSVGADLYMACPKDEGQTPRPVKIRISKRISTGEDIVRISVIGNPSIRCLLNIWF